VCDYHTTDALRVFQTNVVPAFASIGRFINSVADLHSFSIIRLPPSYTLFPYTTLFRSAILNFLDESPERKTSFIEISRGGKLPYKTGSPAISVKVKAALALRY